jgi:putative flippase GtrA
MTARLADGGARVGGLDGLPLPVPVRPAPRAPATSDVRGQIVCAIVSQPSMMRRYQHVIRQFVKFGLVGGAGVVVNMVVAIIMNKLHGGTARAQEILFTFPGTPYNFRFTTLVWIVAFLVANLFNFQLNRYWTFRHAHRASWLREFWPFLAVGSTAALIGIFIKIGFTNPTSPLYLPEPWFHENAGLQSREYWAQFLTIVITTPINFVVNKLWTFRYVRRLHGRDRGADG